MPWWGRRVALALVAVQLADVLGNALVPRAVLERHLDRLGLPRPLRPLLQPVKLVTAAGLLAGTRVPRVGGAAAGGLVAYYSAAATFHVLAGDHPVVAVPAVACGAAAAVVVVSV